MTLAVPEEEAPRQGVIAFQAVNFSGSPTCRMRALGLPEVLAYDLLSVQLPLRVVSRESSATAAILPASLHLPPAAGGGKNFQLRSSVG